MWIKLARQKMIWSGPQGDIDSQSGPGADKKMLQVVKGLMRNSKFQVTNVFAAPPCAERSRRAASYLFSLSWHEIKSKTLLLVLIHSHEIYTYLITINSSHQRP